MLRNILSMCCKLMERGFGYKTEAKAKRKWFVSLKFKEINLNKQRQLKISHRWLLRMLFLVCSGESGKVHGRIHSRCIEKITRRCRAHLCMQFSLNVWGGATHGKVPSKCCTWNANQHFERNMNDLSKVNICNQHRNAFKKSTVQSLLQGD